MGFQDRWAASARYWQIVPHKSYGIFLAAIFCLFVALGFVLTFSSDAWWHVRWATLVALTIGILAVGWVHAWARHIIWLVCLMFLLQLAVPNYIGHLTARHTLPLAARDFTHEAIHARLRLEAVFMSCMILAGYVLVLFFVRAEGQRVFGPITEVRLARDVHQRLVPEIARAIGGYEIYGISVPSGEVGGDLVDLIQDGKNWIAYVGDVCGHGVPAGMIMAMVKSAARAAPPDGASLAGFLSHLNRVLKELSAPNDFVTLACIAGDERSGLEFSLAGHYPILHYSKSAGTVEELTVSNPPLAVFSDSSFTTSSILCNEGDILAVVTDGLTEVADKKGKELGLEPLKAVLLQSDTGPLRAIAQALRDAALRQGKQADDQTILLVRRRT